MSGKYHVGLSSINIPEAYRTVLHASTCESFIIWTERYGLNRSCMSSQCFLMFAGVCIPETDGIVPTPTCQYITIRTEYYVIGNIRMSGQCFLIFTGMCIPELNAIVSPTKKSFSIGAEHYTASQCYKPVFRLVKCFYGLSCVRIPETNNSCAAPTCDRVPIRIERYTIDLLQMSSEYLFRFAGVCIPEADGTITTSTCDCVSIRTEC